jgi:hypothetical protein
MAEDSNEHLGSSDCSSGIEYDWQASNRGKSKTAKLGLFWCRACDTHKVGQHGKCEACGHKENRNKIRQ